MIQKGGGHVVTMSSLSGLYGSAGYTGYGSTKHAVRGLINSLRKECIREGADIQFTTAFPFFVATAMENIAQPKMRFVLIFVVIYIYIKVSLIFRFTTMMTPLPPSYVAKKIIAAQRQGIYDIILPKSIRYGLFLVDLLPESAQSAIFDFFYTGKKEI